MKIPVINRFEGEDGALGRRPAPQRARTPRPTNRDGQRGERELPRHLVARDEGVVPMSDIVARDRSKVSHGDSLCGHRATNSRDRTFSPELWVSMGV